MTRFIHSQRLLGVIVFIAVLGAIGLLPNTTKTVHADDACKPPNYDKITRAFVLKPRYVVLIGIEQCGVRSLLGVNHHDYNEFRVEHSFGRVIFLRQVSVDIFEDVACEAQREIDFTYVQTLSSGLPPLSAIVCGQ